VSPSGRIGQRRPRGGERVGHHAALARLQQRPRLAVVALAGVAPVQFEEQSRQRVVGQQPVLRGQELGAGGVVANLGGQALDGRHRLAIERQRVVQPSLFESDVAEVAETPADAELVLVFTQDRQRAFSMLGGRVPLLPVTEDMSQIAQAVCLPASITELPEHGEAVVETPFGLHFVPLSQQRGPEVAHGQGLASTASGAAV
jgi:hypothetical protein